MFQIIFLINVFFLMSVLHLLARTTRIHAQPVLSSHQSLGEVTQKLSTRCRLDLTQAFPPRCNFLVCTIRDT